MNLIGNVKYGKICSDHLKKVVNVIKCKKDFYILATERNAKLFECSLPSFGRT